MRKLLKALGWVAGVLVGLVVLFFVVFFGINATDEPLSDGAQALLKRSPPPAPSESNAYINFLALGAPADAPTFATGTAQLAAVNGRSDARLPDPEIDPQLKRCEFRDFLSCVAANPALPALVQAHAMLLERYLTMRGKPEFVDLHAPESPDDAWPSYAAITRGQRLVLTRAAIDFNAGRRAAAIDQLRTEFAFYRKVAAGSRTPLAKLVAFARLDDSALFATDMARRAPPGDKASRARLAALLRAPTQPELDIVPALREEQAQFAGWMRTRRFVRMSDATYEEFIKDSGRKRPWWDPIAPWLYRPHYSVNQYVARSSVWLAVAERPASEFLAAQAEAREREGAWLSASVWKLLVLSPATTFHFHFGTHDLSLYIGKMHGHAALQSLAALQVRLRAAGLTTPAEVEDALAGPLGAAHANPFTGKPMEFDAKTFTLGFACDRKYLGSGARQIFADGMVTLPL